MKRQIEIYIEELALEGFAASERDAIGDALTRELETLLRGADPALLHVRPPAESDAGALEFDRLDAGNITLKPKASPATVGGQVARAVYGSLNSLGQSGNRSNSANQSASRKSG